MAKKVRDEMSETEDYTKNKEKKNKERDRRKQRKEKGRV